MYDTREEIVEKIKEVKATKSYHENEIEICDTDIRIYENMLKDFDDNHPEVNPNGSLLTPDTITYCNDCKKEVHKEVAVCPNCGSTKVEHINEN